MPEGTEWLDISYFSSLAQYSIIVNYSSSLIFARLVFLLVYICFIVYGVRMGYKYFNQDFACKLLRGF